MILLRKMVKPLPFLFFTFVLSYEDSIDFDDLSVSYTLLNECMLFITIILFKIIFVSLNVYVQIYYTLAFLYFLH